MIWSVDEKPPACPLVDPIGVRYSLARSRRTPASDLDSVMIIGGSPLHGSTRPAGRQRFGFGREAGRNEAARKGTRMGEHAEQIFALSLAPPALSFDHLVGNSEQPRWEC